MTAHELARLLLAGPDLPVHLRQDANDYWQTVLAPPVTTVREEDVRESRYHNTDVVLVEDAKRDEDAPCRTVLVIG